MALLTANRLQVWNYRFFGAKAALSKKNLKVQKKVNLVKDGKTIATNQAYETCLKEQLRPIEDQCIRELLQLRRKAISGSSLRCNIKKEGSAVKEHSSLLLPDIGDRMAFLLDQVSDVQSRIAASIPPPDEFIQTHINSLMRELVRTDTQFVDKKQVKSVPSSEGHFSNFTLFQQRNRHKKYNSNNGGTKTNDYSIRNSGKTGDDKALNGCIPLVSELLVEKYQLGHKRPAHLASKHHEFESTSASDIYNKSQDDSAAGNNFDGAPKLTPLFRIWQDLGAEFFVHNNTVCPKAFRHVSTISSYRHCRSAAVVFDLSYKRHIRFRGSDIASIVERFVGSNPCLSAVPTGEVRYGCLVDSSGLVMDDCWVLKQQPASIENATIRSTVQSEYVIDLVTSGFEHETLMEYLRTQLKSVDSKRPKQNRVKVEYLDNSVIIGLQGPQSSTTLSNLVLYSSRNRKTNNCNQVFLSLVPPFSFKLSILCDSSAAFALENNCLLTKTQTSSSAADFNINLFRQARFPYMSSFKLLFEYEIQAEVKTVVTCMRIGTAGEDGFEIIMDKASVAPFTILLLWLRNTTAAGLLALDMLRMESGFPLSGCDFTRMESPVQAGLLSSLDPEMIQTKKLYGSKNISYQLENSRTKRRVGLLCEEFVLPGCQIFSFPERAFLGLVKSCSWSPAFKRRLAMASISNDAVLHGQLVLVRVADSSPKSRKAQCRRGIWIFPIDPNRRLVKARILQLPFVPHRVDPEQSRNNQNLFDFIKMNQTSYKAVISNDENVFILSPFLEESVVLDFCVAENVRLPKFQLYLKSIETNN